MGDIGETGAALDPLRPGDPLRLYEGGDGDLIEFMAHGHVDKEAFLTRLRADGEAAADEATIESVWHVYRRFIPDGSSDGGGLYWPAQPSPGAFKATILEVL
jgi:hypothetical protein